MVGTVRLNQESGVLSMHRRLEGEGTCETHQSVEYQTTANRNIGRQGPLSNKSMPPDSKPTTGLHWYTVLDATVNPDVVSNAICRQAITQTGMPWRVEDVATGIVFVLIPRGVYIRGTSASDPFADDDETPSRIVEIARPFYIAQTEVTNAQYRGTGRHPLPGFKPLHHSGLYKGMSIDQDRQPVVNVSWTDSVAFCTAFGMRLPSEDEWEYACRGGTTTKYQWGTDISRVAIFANTLTPRTNRAFGYGWESVGALTQDPSDKFDPTGPDDPFDVSAPVGSFRPNGFGLHDTIGNVEEWCIDEYHGSFSIPNLHAIRGGSYCFPGASFRSARRMGAPDAPLGIGEHGAHSQIGFRPVKDP